MDENENDERIRLRAVMAQHMRNAAQELSRLLSLWWDNELEGDFLVGKEYPFQVDLEEQIAALHAAADAIIDNNEWMQMKPITFTVSKEEFVKLLAELEEPARPLPRLAALMREASPFEN